LIELATKINLVNIRIECIPVRPTPENPTYSSIAVVFGIKGAIRQAIFFKHESGQHGEA
jgi:hypothetical protein